MSATTAAPVIPAKRELTTKPRFSDKVFRGIVTAGGSASLVILGLIALFLALKGFNVLATEKFSFITESRWEVLQDENGNLAALDPLEEEIGLYIAEVIMELEEEEAVKVREHVDLDINTDFGVALDVGIHTEKITHKEIEKFIKDFNEDTLKLDENLYSFQTQDMAQ